LGILLSESVVITRGRAITLWAGLAGSGYTRLVDYVNYEGNNAKFEEITAH